MYGAATFTMRQIEYFDAIASEGSLSSAAEVCHVSASALALAIDELERRLSVQLFVRQKGKGVTLSPAGSRLLPHARQILADAEGFAAEASQSATGLTGRLAIGCFTPLAPFFLAAVMDGFHRLNPNLDLQFAEATAPELADQLLHGRIDTALLYSVDVPAQLTFDPLRAYRPFVLIAADHPLAARGTVALADLMAEPLIELDVRPSRQNTKHIFATAGLTPAMGEMVANYELARCLIGRGLGYSVFVQRPASLMTYDGHRLATLEISDAVEQIVVGLARPHGAPRTAKAIALHDFFSAHP